MTSDGTMFFDWSRMAREQQGGELDVADVLAVLEQGPAESRFGTTEVSDKPKFWGLHAEAFAAHAAVTGFAAAIRCVINGEGANQSRTSFADLLRGGNFSDGRGGAPVIHLGRDFDEEQEPGDPFDEALVDAVCADRTIGSELTWRGVTWRLLWSTVTRSDGDDDASTMQTFWCELVPSEAVDMTH